MKSPGRRASKLGKFKPTLIPLPPKLPSDVGELMASMNRKERRGFAVKARAHVTRKRDAETFEREEADAFEVGPTFHVTDARSLFGAGPPVGFTCPGEDCPACAADRENAKSAATITVARVDRELGTFTAKTP